MLLFRSEEHVARWCKRWKIARGALLTLEQGWGLAKVWYHDRLDPGWRSLSPREAQALFRSLGLTSSFWRF